MSLSATMNIGRSALTASQLGLQVTGNNMANAATPGYSRQVATMSPIRGVGAGPSGSAGRGVQVTDIRRQIDEALQTRLRSGLADEAAATQKFQTMSQLEAVLGELGENDLSSELSRFFNSWSERANQTKSSGVVVQQGERLAQYMQRIRSDFVNQRGLLDRQLGALVESADTILTKVGDLNTAIADAEVSGAEASALRDERDNALNELGTLLDISAVEQPDGMVDVLVGSTPIMLNGESRGLVLSRGTDGTNSRVSIIVRATGQELDVRSGQVGALISDRGGTIDSSIENLDQLASQLIFEINRIHSTGTNLKGLSAATGELIIADEDRARPFNDPANTTFADLPFEVRNGGFFINVKQTSTGQMQSVRINVDLDGIDAAGLPGIADDTSAEDIRAALGAVPGLTATFTPDGRLDIRAAAGFEFSFSEDTSGALAVLGVNTYFQGTSADNIGVRAELSRDPNTLATGRVIDGTFRENGNALEIVRMQNRDVQGLGSRTFQAAWSDTASAIGSQAAAAKTNAEAASLVRAGLEAQRAGISGVSLDEESINLLAYQRQYQGAARLISVADEMFSTLVSLI